MFESLFSYPAVRHRHYKGPFARERMAFLESLAAQGAAKGTLLKWARYCLCVAKELQKWPHHRLFTITEVNTMAGSWANKRVADGRANTSRWPQEHFRLVAIEFLKSMGRLFEQPAPRAGPYEDHVDKFIMAQRERGWQSSATCKAGRWQIHRFLSFLEKQGVALENITAEHIDAYFQHVSQIWSRVSIATAAKTLRPWFRYCELRNWANPGLSETILVPRIYRHEGLPLGPTWNEVSRMLSQTTGDKPAQLRDRAILLLLSVYGLRSGEVRRLCLDDMDWQRERLRIVRSKSSQPQILPLNPSVGNAIARYLRDGRPKSDSRVLFLTLIAPYRPLSTGGLYNVVKRYFCQVSSASKGRGPHGLRHACARYLTEAGLSFKEIGDHLGHRSPDATRIYAKVDLTSLRLVALEDLGGLT